MNAIKAFMAKPDWHVLTGLFPKIGFLWPSFLWGLLLVPVIAGVYILLLRRRALIETVKRGATDIPAYRPLAPWRRPAGSGWRSSQSSAWRRYQVPSPPH